MAFRFDFSNLKPKPVTETDASIEQTQTELQAGSGEFDSEAGDVQNFHKLASETDKEFYAGEGFYPDFSYGERPKPYGTLSDLQERLKGKSYRVV